MPICGSSMSSIHKPGSALLLTNALMHPLYPRTPRLDGGYSRTMIPEAIHSVIRNAQTASQPPPDDKSAFFWVDWNEDDDQIPGMCEAILKTGQLAADWDDDTLVIVWRGARIPVSLTKSPLTRSE